MKPLCSGDQHPRKCIERSLFSIADKKRKARNIFNHNGYLWFHDPLLRFVKYSHIYIETSGKILYEAA